MSKSLFATLLAAGVSWTAVSCVMSPKPGAPVASTAAHPTAAMASAAASASAKPTASPTPAQAPAPAPVSATTATVATVVSPWKDSGIFFYPLTLMAFAFGIALYKTSNKTT